MVLPKRATKKNIVNCVRSRRKCHPCAGREVSSPALQSQGYSSCFILRWDRREYVTTSLCERECRSIFRRLRIRVSNPPPPLPPSLDHVSELHPIQAAKSPSYVSSTC